MLDVTGIKIRSIGADGTGLGRVKLLKLSDQSVAADITQLGINDPSRLMFSLPGNLAAGEYPSAYTIRSVCLIPFIK